MTRFGFTLAKIARPVGLSLLLTLCGIWFANRELPVRAAREGDGKQPVPVLVELFTSEGCSSCPPADTLLARLDATQFVPGAQAIVLSEHVTYWDHLGWRDPYSLPSMTQHQQQYASRFGLEDVYTPQVVVDGANQLVGSDEDGLRRAVAKAASVSKAEIAINDAKRVGNSVRFSVHEGAGTEKDLLIGALAEDAARTEVPRGENEGRTLHHVAVVRVMQSFQSQDGLTLTMPGPSQDGPVRLVVFLVDRGNGHVLAATERTISR